jgi:hypothetical protein
VSISEAHLTLFGDENDPELKDAVALLAKSGLSYRVKARADGEAAKLSSSNGELADLRREHVMHFLWSLGAQFEDS